jgi:hypothetical protein
MKYIYLLFTLLTIYLLYCYYKKYGNQENFDPPSVDPVPDISDIFAFDTTDLTSEWNTEPEPDVTINQSSSNSSGGGSVSFPTSFSFDDLTAKNLTVTDNSSMNSMTSNSLSVNGSTTSNELTVNGLTKSQELTVNDTTTSKNLNVTNKICIQDTCLSDPYSIKILLQPIIRRGATNDRVPKFQYIVSDIYPCAIINGSEGVNQRIFHMPVGEYVNLVSANCLDVWKDQTWRLGSSWKNDTTPPTSLDAVNNVDSGLQYVGRGSFYIYNVSECEYIVLKEGYSCYFSKNYYSYGIEPLTKYVGTGQFTELNSILEGLANNNRYMKIVKD